MQEYDVDISLGEKMEMLRVKHNLYTDSILINCFCPSSQLPLALGMLGKMMKLGYDPNVITLSSLLMDTFMGIGSLRL
ncbi:hypothetical protein F2Q68_00025770 [Brassica cretica]|uniref:Pentatricopeptide repeat-containing protein n=1 Tax=Brassica cretica TaxID=69181 RepID=A0A8S9I736_BRACR|nr:hypothetical protein F2Q68_00025770 [Brassica cretica]